MNPSTDWKEDIAEGEAHIFEALAAQLHDLQLRAAKGGPPGRALHKKAQAGVKALLEVPQGLPEHARFGPFAQPATYQAYLRYSNGAGRRQRDSTPDVRGLAVKLLGVDARDALERFAARRAGVTDSGVSKNNRVVERLTGRQTPYFWKSYDFSSSRGPQNMFRDPVDLHRAGGEMVWGLPNGLQAYFVVNQRGERIEAAPTAISSHPATATR